MVVLVVLSILCFEVGVYVWRSWKVLCCSLVGVCKGYCFFCDGVGDYCDYGDVYVWSWVLLWGFEIYVDFIIDVLGYCDDDDGWLWWYCVWDNCG